MKMTEQKNLLFKDEQGNLWDALNNRVLRSGYEQPLLLEDASLWSVNGDEVSANAFELKKGTLIIYRGPPGSGASEECEALRSFFDGPIFGLSHYFERQGRSFDGREVATAIQAERKGVEDALFAGEAPYIYLDAVNSRISMFEWAIRCANHCKYNWVVLQPNTSWRDDMDECIRRFDGNPDIVVRAFHEWEE